MSGIHRVQAGGCLETLTATSVTLSCGQASSGALIVAVFVITVWSATAGSMTPVIVMTPPAPAARPATSHSNASASYLRVIAAPVMASGT